jgi:hypothetical protein
LSRDPEVDLATQATYQNSAFSSLISLFNDIIYDTICNNIPLLLQLVPRGRDRRVRLNVHPAAGVYKLTTHLDYVFVDEHNRHKRLKGMDKMIAIMLLETLTNS